MSISIAEYKAMLKKGPKYKSKAVNADDKYFPSKFEAAVYQVLYLRQKSGEFDEIERQVQIELTAGITHKVDFVAKKNGERVLLIEAKGFEDNAWQLKKKLYKKFTKLPLEIWKGTHSKPFLSETILPKNF